MLCRSGERRMNWYLTKGLAEKVSESPPTIKLKFEPAGEGDAGDSYMLADRANQCVVCGQEQELTRHHVVPYSYRIHFPEECKRHTSYDVLPLCVKCHQKYELHAQDFRSQILNELKLKAGEIKLDLIAAKAIKSATALLRHNDNIPAERKFLLEEKIKDFLGKNKLSQADVENVAKMEWKVVPDNFSSASKKVVETIKDLDVFARRWRCHFVAMMNPAFLPAHWDIDKRLYS